MATQTMVRDNSVLSSALSSVENAKGASLSNSSGTHPSSGKKGENKKTGRRKTVATITQLRRREARRSPKARAADESREHSVVIHPINKAGVAKWMKDPASEDIRGVDTPGVRESAQQILHERAEHLRHVKAGSSPRNAVKGSSGSLSTKKRVTQSHAVP